MTSDDYWREVAHILAGALAWGIADKDPMDYRQMVLDLIASEPGEAV